jgi:hypothetical protein
VLAREASRAALPRRETSPSRSAGPSWAPCPPERRRSAALPPEVSPAAPQPPRASRHGHAKRAR